MATSKIKVCPTCQHENKMTALKCAECGSPLVSGRTTIRVTDLPSDIAREPLETASKAKTDALTFYVAGKDQPMVVEQKEVINIGRRSPDDPPIELDLSEHNAFLLGVSRNHASIVKTPEGYGLQDLGSTNGTWLNETRLLPNRPQPLRNGDQIRLGQFILFVYFSSSHPTEQTISLIERLGEAPTTPKQNLTAVYFTASVSPFLGALAALQQAIDKMHERMPAEVTINTIIFSKTRASTSVKLAGAGDAIRIVTEKLPAWRSVRAAAIAALGTGGSSAAGMNLATKVLDQGSATSAATSSQTAGDNSTDGKAEPAKPEEQPIPSAEQDKDTSSQPDPGDGVITLPDKQAGPPAASEQHDPVKAQESIDKALAALADEIVTELIPHKTDEDKKRWAEQLAPDLRTLATGPLEIG